MWHTDCVCVCVFVFIVFVFVVFVFVEVRWSIRQVSCDTPTVFVLLT